MPVSWCYKPCREGQPRAKGNFSSGQVSSCQSNISQNITNRDYNCVYILSPWKDSQQLFKAFHLQVVTIKFTQFSLKDSLSPFSELCFGFLEHIDEKNYFLLLRKSHKHIVSWLINSKQNAYYIFGTQRKLKVTGTSLELK